MNQAFFFNCQKNELFSSTILEILPLFTWQVFKIHFGDHPGRGFRHQLLALLGERNNCAVNIYVTGTLWPDAGDPAASQANAPMWPVNNPIFSFQVTLCNYTAVPGISGGRYLLYRPWLSIQRAADEFLKTKASPFSLLCSLLIVACSCIAPLRN